MVEESTFPFHLMHTFPLLASFACFSIVSCFISNSLMVFPPPWGRVPSVDICRGTKTPLCLISFSHVSFRMWGLRPPGVSDLPLARPQSPILSSFLPSSLCFSCLPSIAFALEQSLEIFKYLSTLHLSAGAAAGPSVENPAPRFLPSVSTRQNFYNIFSFSPIQSLLTSGTYNPSIQNNQPMSELRKKKKKEGRKTGWRSNNNTLCRCGDEKINVRV